MADDEEEKEKRKYAIEMVKHPLNRSFFLNVLKMLRPGGKYGWPDLQQVFTREEIEQYLQEAAHEELAEYQKKHGMRNN